MDDNIRLDQLYVLGDLLFWIGFSLGCTGIWSLIMAVVRDHEGNAVLSFFLWIIAIVCFGSSWLL